MTQEIKNFSLKWTIVSFHHQKYALYYSRESCNKVSIIIWEEIITPGMISINKENICVISYNQISNTETIVVVFNLSRPVVEAGKNINLAYIFPT